MEPTLVTRVVWNSQNAKTGTTALSTSRTISSCPTSCGLNPVNWPDGKGPCYAAQRGQGGRQSIFTMAGDGQIEGTDYALLVDAIAALKPSSAIRLNVSGDYLLPDGSPDHAYIEATNTARDHRILSYTHAWRQLDPKWFESTTRPNASCDTVDEIAVARSLGWDTVIVVPEHEDTRGIIVAGSRLVVCPNANNKAIQCIDCMACARHRTTTIVFPAHGVRRRKVEPIFTHLERTG